MKTPVLIVGLSALLILPGTAPRALAQAPADSPINAPVVPETPTTSTPGATAPTASQPATNVDDTARLREATLAYNAGLAALKKNDWNGAAERFARAAALSPSDAGALSFLGYVRLQQRRWDDALTALQAAQDNGKDLDVRARAQLLNNIGFARWNKAQNAEARVAFEEALSLDPDYFDARYNLAFSLLSRAQYGEALPHLRQLSLKNPRDAAIQDGLGEAFEKTGNLPGALGAYKRAVALNPQNETGRLKFALALLAAERRPEATEQLRLVLAKNPNNAPALLQLGDIHLRSNRWNEAATTLRRYTALRGNDFTGRFNLAVALDYGAKFDEALGQYAIAERLRPNDAATKNNVGRIYFKRKRFDEAIGKFNSALALDANFYDARTNLAIVLAAQNKWDDSNAQWQQLAQSADAQARTASDANQKKALQARLTTAYAGLASNYGAQNKWREAAAEYRRLLAISPADLEARSGLGRALYNLKDWTGAEGAYRDIIARDPKNANAHNDLGVVLEAKRDRKSALEFYTQAVALDPNHSEAKSNLARLRGAAVVS